MFRIMVTLVCVGLLGAVALADISNGSFSDGTTTGWTTTLTQSASSQVLGSYLGNTNVLNLTATNNYTWVTDEYGSYWSLNEADYSKANVFQMCFAPSGATALTFKASAAYQGANIYGTDSSGMPTAVVSATYMQVGSMIPGTSKIIVNSQDWNTTEQINLTNIDTSQLVTVRVMLTSELSDSEPENGTSTTVVVDGKFDDFQFVPEPCTALLILGGMAAALVRRARRRA